MSWHIYVTLAPLSPAPFRSFPPPSPLPSLWEKILKKSRSRNLSLQCIFCLLEAVISISFCLGLFIYLFLYCIFFINLFSFSFCGSRRIILFLFFTCFLAFFWFFYLSKKCWWTIWHVFLFYISFNLRMVVMVNLHKTTGICGNCTMGHSAQSCALVWTGIELILFFIFFLAACTVWDSVGEGCWWHRGVSGVSH